MPTDERVLAALQRVTDAALAHLSEDDLLTELLRRISEILNSDTAAILLLEPDGTELRARAAKGIEEEVEQGVRIPVGKGFAGRIAADLAGALRGTLDHIGVAPPQGALEALPTMRRQADQRSDEWAAAYARDAVLAPG